MDGGFSTLAATLTTLLQEAAPAMTVAGDDAGGCQLTTTWDNPRKPGEKMWFASVRVGKAYVSYHLMPVYTHPDLAAKISPALRKRMQGKSCFNFKAPDESLFADLETLTREAAAVYATPFTL